MKIQKPLRLSNFQVTIGGDTSDDEVDEYVVIDELNESDEASKRFGTGAKDTKSSQLTSKRVEKEVTRFFENINTASQVIHNASYK